METPNQNREKAEYGQYACPKCGERITMRQFMENRQDYRLPCTRDEIYHSQCFDTEAARCDH